MFIKLQIISIISVWLSKVTLCLSLFSIVSSYRLFSNMVVLLSGGFSSQLENYVDAQEISASPLWCCQYLASNPGVIIRTHEDYIKAGSEVLTTNTFQASVCGFQKHLGIDYNSSLNLIKEGVYLARKAIKNSAKEGQNILVAGSVGSYGACLCDGSEYTGTYMETLTAAELKEWHRPRILALVEAGVNMLAVETIPALGEAVAVLELLKDDFPNTKAWVSFSCKDERHLCHGELFSEAMAQCCDINRAQLVAVGVNCLSPALVSPLLRIAQGHDVPFIVYPNSGEIWKPGVGYTNKEACVPLVQYVSDWISLGATYIGGCCRTTAEDIKQLRDHIDVHSSQLMS